MKLNKKEKIRGDLCTDLVKQCANLMKEIKKTRLLAKRLADIDKEINEIAPSDINAEELTCSTDIAKRLEKLENTIEDIFASDK